MLALIMQEQRERLVKSAIIYMVFCVHFIVTWCLLEIWGWTNP